MLIKFLSVFEPVIKRCELRHFTVNQPEVTVTLIVLYVVVSPYCKLYTVIPPMASATQLESNTSVNHQGSSESVTQLSVRIARGVRLASFWLAIVLPFAYLPLLTTELTLATVLLFFGLFGANVLALIIGHGHNQ